MSASLIRRLIEAGTPDELVDEVAELLASARAIEKRRAADASRKQAQRKRESVRHVTSRDTCDIQDNPPPNEYISNPPVFDVSNETSAVSDLATRVVGDWNQKIAGTPLPAARKLSPDRLKHLRARVRQHGEEAVFTAIRNMTASDFHSGRSGKWLEGCLGWLLKNNENFEKMLERTNSQPPPATPSNLSLLIDQAKRYPKDQAA